MKVDFIKSKKDWEDFLMLNNGSFLQSTIWCQFKKEYQNTYQLEARQENTVVGLCQFFKEKTPFGNYFYVPHGPIGKNQEVINNLLNELFKIAERENIFFIRIEPLTNITIGINSFSRIQPQKTLVLDINKNNEDILRSFSSGTRRNINIAIKNNVIIKEENNTDLFYHLLLKTLNRKKFKSYNKIYFENLIKNTPAKISCAYYKNEVIASNIILYYNKTAYCLHSATDHKNRKLKGSNLLRYKSIINARDAGLIKFDNWGIDEVRYPGVTKFKKGFGGKEFVYPEGKDIVLKKITYNLYKYSFLLKKKI